MERPFLAAKNFNADLVQFLPPFYGIISNVHVSCFTCKEVHLNRFCVHKKLIHEGLTLQSNSRQTDKPMEGVYWAFTW